MKIIIDDTYYSVSEKVGKYGTSEIFNFSNNYDLDKCLLELLTPSQYLIFIGWDTRRTFDVADKKIEAYKLKHIA